ncbi:hypothetical protein H5P28_15020 [Ruficoccus amylovorans]|uniref:Uncharacterized protein n=1 Tax=Ruficoccus amylovorans TaxID=1804625 RepID=A0A842HJA4_9BACT|nr:hypothetical protein [Ruficoccus amylovorans]MBC2595577.1 hypothetical protein [Ruficoccus amylovorans]
MRIPSDSFNGFRAGCPPGGFALIIALSLMSFMILLLIGFTTFIRVETGTQAVVREQEKARQNALLGLRMAVGELQKYLGPDTRVSARAELLDSNPSTDTAEGVTQPYWTGVWSAPELSAPTGYPEELNPRATPQLLTWLVSGNTNTVSYRPDEDTLDDANSKVLVPELTLGDGSTLPEVRAPLVRTEEGGFAYWVQDEGVKAKLSAVAANFDAEDDPLLPLNSGSEAFSDHLSASLITNPTDWRAVYTMDFAMADGEEPDQLSHDVTLNGYGVLADSLRGGLKYDLSSILSMSETEFDADVVPLMPGERVYEPYAPSGTFNYRGPKWNILQRYGALLDGSNQTRGWQISGSDVVSAGVYPVMERFQLYVTVNISDNLGDATDPGAAVYRPRLYFIPAIVLWNPYDKPLTAPRGYKIIMKAQGDPWDYVYAAGYYDGSGNWKSATVVDGSESGAVIGGFEPMLQSSEPYRFFLEGASDAAVVIPPGQAVVFTMIENKDANSGSREYTMRPGQRGLGFYLDANSDFRLSADDLTEMGGGDIYLDIRGDEWDNSYTAAMIFQSYDVSTNRPLQWIGELRWATNGDTTLAPTVSELGSHNFNDGDPNGPAPFIVGVNSIPSSSIDEVFLVGNTAPLGYEMGLKIPDANIQVSLPEMIDGFRPLSQHNPRAFASSRALGKQAYRNSNYYSGTVFQNVGLGQYADQDYLIETWDGDHTAAYTGDRDTAGGARRVAYFHLPDSVDEVRSVGDLRHLDLSSTDVLRNANSTAASFGNSNYAPSFIIGEARADTSVPFDSYVPTNLASADARKVVDHHWIANRQFWDRFFVSTVPATGAVGLPLANGRMQPVGLSGTALTESQIEDLRQFRRAASNLMVDGAFNVNSTSVKAWMALLSQYVGRTVKAEDGASYTDGEESPFVDLPNPLGGPVPANASTASEELYNGFRRLDQDEIRELAEAIVTEVKRRGPFLSLADFVNRQLVSDATTYAESGGNLPSSQPTPTQLAEDPRFFGTLQSAIERAELNADFEDNLVNLSESPWSDTFDIETNLAAAAGSYMEGAPGYLTQGKLLARLGPILSARSDTFTVRGYGESRDLNDRVTATARYEAVVQRLPDYVSSTDDPEVRPGDLASDDNKNFGRRFQVVGFRWLNE